MVERQYIEELLPFWVNGSLSDQEAAEVKAALADDPSLQRDEQLLRALYTNLNSAHQDMHAEQSPGEFGLARLMRGIEQSEAQSPAEYTRGRVMALVGAAGLAAAALVLVVGPLVQAPEPTYEQASGDAGDLVLTVAFRDDVAQSRLAETLLNYDLTIVDGPSAIGLFRLAPLDAQADLAVLAEALLAETDIFVSVDLP